MYKFSREKQLNENPTEKKEKLLHYQTKAHTLFHHLLGEEIDLLLLLLGFHPLEERHKKELLVALVTHSNASLCDTVGLSLTVVLMALFRD